MHFSLRCCSNSETRFIFNTCSNTVKREHKLHTIFRTLNSIPYVYLPLQSIVVVVANTDTCTRIHTNLRSERKRSYSSCLKHEHRSLWPWFTLSRRVIDTNAVWVCMCISMCIESTLVVLPVHLAISSVVLCTSSTTRTFKIHNTHETNSSRRIFGRFFFCITLLQL